MCLIITGKASKVLGTLLQDAKLLQDIIHSNGDGLGAMYATSKGKLRMPKIVTKDYAAQRQFLQQLPADDRDIAIHFRMKTHGAIDMTNCHPYTVLDGQLAMMHNGVLSWVDDKSDLTKSDTWHYIEQYARPMLQEAPGLFKVRAWQEIVEEHIGTGNRFVFMNASGEMAILNYHTGIEHDGMWFSNTYAWSPELLIPNYKAAAKRSRWPDDDDALWTWNGMDLLDARSGKGGASTGTVADSSKVVNMTAHLHMIQMGVLRCLAEGDADEMEDLLQDYPVSVADELFTNYEYTCHIEPTALAKQDAEVVELLTKGLCLGVRVVAAKSDASRRRVAEAICYYGTWTHKESKEDAYTRMERLEDEEEDEEEDRAFEEASERAMTEHLKSIAKESPVPALCKADPKPACAFEVGKLYLTRDGELRRVIDIDLTFKFITVEPLDQWITSTRWLDGACLINGRITGRDLVPGAVELQPVPEVANNEAYAG